MGDVSQNINFDKILMLKAFFHSKQWALWAYGGLSILLFCLYLQVKLTVNVNEWFGKFYDMLQNANKHTLSEFWEQIYLYTKIAFPYIIIATFTSYITRIYALKWREAITFLYIPCWKKTDSDIEGASQRIQEDIYRFAKIVETLGLQIVRAIMTLIAFLPILWKLSNKIYIAYLPKSGTLVYLAIFVSIGGLIISWFVGIKLPRLEYNNQKIEAAFRKELVLAENNRQNYAKPMTISSIFSELMKNYLRLFNHYGYFDMWLNFFEQLMLIVPYLVAGPFLLSGYITLGILVQIADAFSKVRESFSIFISNWTTITELRSIHQRLIEFEKYITV